MPVIWFSIAYFAGLLAADQLSWNLFWWFFSGTLCCLLILIVFMLLRGKLKDGGKDFRNLLISLSVAFFIGGIRFQATLPNFQDPAFILNYADQPWIAELTGVVVGFPDKRDQIINLRIQSETLDNPREETSIVVYGLVLAKIPAEENVSYGDRVKVTAYLKQPPEGEDFNYRTYLQRQKIYVYMPNAEITILERDVGGSFFLRGIYKLRARALAHIYQLWPDPEASLLAGILLGVETGISDKVQKAFRETGTTHIIAISGFNITIVAGLFSRFFSRILNPRQGALAAMVGISFYTLLVGADAAVMRAAVMGVLSIFAQQLGRRQHGINAAALASLIMAILNPQLPWDISFQLSLSATMGLILYADPLTNWFLRFVSKFLSRERAEILVGPVSEFILLTFAAQLTTLPVMIYHFRVFSLNTFLTNPAILPVQPPIMLLGGLALILSLIWMPLGIASAPLVYPFVLFTIRVVERFSSLPINPSHFGPIKLIWIILFYALLALMTFGRPLLVYFSLVITRASAVSALAVLVIITWRMAFSIPDGLLHLYLMDVGTGSALYILTPDGQRIIINGGPSSRRLSDLLGRKLPPFQREVNYWLIASPLEQDLDAVAENILRFRPDQILWLGDGSNCWEAVSLRTMLDDNGIPLIYGISGQTLEMRNGPDISILSESKSGGTLSLEYGSFRILLPFGLLNETREEWDMGLDLGEMTVLLLADNGYESTNPSVWINNLNPQLVLLSVGVDDSRGLPDRGLIDRLGGYSLLRTDQHGDLHLLTDGKNLWVRVERLP